MLLGFALVLLSLPVPDCGASTEAATRAYREAIQDVQQGPGAVAQLRRSRDCLLAAGDTTAATREHVSEVYLLTLMDAPAAVERSLKDYFSLFAPRHSLGRYTYLLRVQAALLAAQGDATAAFAVLHRCLVMSPVTQIQDRAETLLRLADLSRSVNNYADGIRYARDAETLLVKHLPPGFRDRRLGRAYLNLAETYLQQYALEDEDPAVLGRAYQIARQAYGLSDALALTDQVHVRHLLGDVLTYKGDYDEAAALIEEAIEMGANGDQFEHMLALYRLGRNRLRAGRLEEARQTLRRAHETSQLQQRPAYTRRIEHDQGMLEWRAGNTDEAERHFRAAIEMVEALRADLGTSEWAAASVSDWQAPYRRLAALLVDKGSLAEAVEVLEQSRARHLAALQARFRRTNALDAGQRGRVDSLLNQLSQLRNRLPAAAGVQRDSINFRIAEAQSGLNRLLGETTTAQPFRVEAYQQTLAGARTVLYYVVQTDDVLWGEPPAYVLVMRRDTLAVRRLPGGARAVGEALARAGILQGERASAGASATALPLDALHALYTLLVQPAADLLTPGAPVTIIPDGPVFGVPFSALVVAPAGRFAYRQALYWGAEHPITTDLSLRAESAVTPAGGPPSLLVVGKSSFERPALAPLPGVRKEVRAIAAPFSRVSSLLDDAATEPAVRAAAARSTVIHFATHALLSSASPLYHELLLSPAPGSDSHLYLHEIEQLSLHASLVTLSGCNTARGGLRAGEGMAGLQYAFRAVGAASTVSTLWSLDDRAGAELFGSFYRHLAEGLPKDVALQQAQQAYRAAHPDASPFLWASPTLYGSTAPVQLPQSRGLLFWALLVAGLALAAFFTYRRVRARRAHPSHATLSPFRAD